MTEDSLSSSNRMHGGIVQLGNKVVSVSGGSVFIYKGNEVEEGKEKKIFEDSPIRLLVPIDDPCGVKVGEKSFLFAQSDRQLAIFRLKKKIPIVTIDVDDEIVDVGAIDVLNIGRIEKKKEEVLRVRLKIPIIYRSGRLKIEILKVDYSDDGRVKKSLKTEEENDCDGGKMKFFVHLRMNDFFGIFEDTVVKSDGTVVRAGEVSQKKKRRVCAMGRELWNDKVILATENGTIRVVKVDEGRENKKNDPSLTMLSSGQIVPPLCTIRCLEPTVIILSETTVIVGSKRGEIHCLSDQLQLIRMFDTEGGPICSLMVDESDGNFLFVGYESGELRRINILAPDENDSPMEEEDSENQEIPEDVKMEIGEGEEGEDQAIITEESKPKSARKVVPPAKKSVTEMKCPLCVYDARDLTTMMYHLKRIHSTNVDLAGLVFRCKCGHEGKSAHHSRYCDISDFEVIRKINGPVRTFHDGKTTPQCILCKKYPKTACGYARHLEYFHDSSLLAQGLFLMCSCGIKARSHHVDPNHNKKCKGRQYTLHKIDKE